MHSLVSICILQNRNLHILVWAQCQLGRLQDVPYVCCLPAYSWHGMGVLERFVDINAFFPLSTSLQDGSHSAEQSAKRQAQTAPHMDWLSLESSQHTSRDVLNFKQLSPLAL